MKEMKHREGERGEHIFVEKLGVIAEAEGLEPSLGPPIHSFCYLDAVTPSRLCHPSAKQSLSVGHLM